MVLATRWFLKRQARKIVRCLLVSIEQAICALFEHEKLTNFIRSACPRVYVCVYAYASRSRSRIRVCTVRVCALCMRMRCACLCMHVDCVPAGLP